MEWTLGDLIILELALANYLKGIDISMHAGQQCAAIIGKIEYQILAIQQQMAQRTPAPIDEIKA